MQVITKDSKPQGHSRITLSSSGRIHFHKAAAERLGLSPRSKVAFATESVTVSGTEVVTAFVKVHHQGVEVRQTADGVYRMNHLATYQRIVEKLGMRPGLPIVFDMRLNRKDGWIRLHPVGNMKSDQPRGDFRTEQDSVAMEVRP